MVPKKSKKVFIVFYITFLIVGYFVVKSALNDKAISVSQKESEGPAFEIKPVKVTLSIPQLARQYKIEMKNADSILDLLETLRRDESSGFFYEKTLYTYGIELCCVGNTTYNWILTQEGKDITHTIDNIRLVDDGHYVLEKAPIRSAEPQ